MRIGLIVVLTLASLIGQAQTAQINGVVSSSNSPVPYADVLVKGAKIGTSTDSSGKFSLNLPSGNYQIEVYAIGFKSIKKSIHVNAGQQLIQNFSLEVDNETLREIVVSGTLKEVSKLESPVSVEVYTAKFFQANPTPTVYEAMQNVNGVRPQINCAVCNTGDIHINGLEGPYTMVLIDGMPIVSGLSTVYGLNGIPRSLIERIEVVKGPASTLYGSEAVGGLINIITKKPVSAPLFSADIFGTSWGELNTDLAGKFRIGQKADVLLGVNHFYFNSPIDNNSDNFTDVTLQNRFSIFNKWRFERKDNKLFSIATRYVYEDRWGGELNWTKANRGGNEIYGESIYTNRWELIGKYELPIREKVMLSFSANQHLQNSVYGTTKFIADQRIVFGQITWDKKLSEHHDLLVGSAMRYTYFDDNTPATSFGDSSSSTNQPSNTYLPGIFFQDEFSVNKKTKMLFGLRYDNHPVHGNIITPRLNYKWSSTNKKTTIRASLGNGYRVANVFTEDHAALTGARDVVFLSELKPEKSWNTNLNWVQSIYDKNGIQINLDATAFFTRFSNKIFPDYLTDPNKIIYDNLEGHAISQGISMNVDFMFYNDWKGMFGITAMDVYAVEEGIRTPQPFTENLSGVWSIGYTLRQQGISIDYTGNLYGPMHLPLLSELDPRSPLSPWWSIQNIQVTKRMKKGLEIYGGVKNLLNWTPAKSNPFLIARSHDPFDENVQFDDLGNVVATPQNPYALTFDPTYVYAPLQGIRGFLGIRYNLN